jgi:hypothetical protein
MITTLPPELILYTLNFLRNNKATLSACSRSCSALATVSKPLLFHTLRTRLDSEAADRFEHLLESDPTILPLVKRIDVTISAFEPGEDPTIMAISWIMTRCHTQHPSPTLNIAIRDTRSNPHLFIKSILPRLYPVVDWVTSLDLDGLDLAEEIGFWNLVLAFRMLKSLALGCLNVGREIAHVPSHPESKISHLSLKESSLGDGRAICRFLADHPIPLPSLTSLDVRFPPEFSRSSIRFGEHYGPRVKTLRFGVLITRHSTKRLDQMLDRKF